MKLVKKVHFSVTKVQTSEKKGHIPKYQIPNKIPKTILKGNSHEFGQKSAQSQKNHGSVVALLPGKFLQIRKVFASKHIFAQKRPFGKETVQMVRKLSGQSKNCPDNLETVQIIQKLSGQSKNCPDNLETVRMIQKLSGH